MKLVCFSNTGQMPLLMNMLNSAVKVGIPIEMFDVYTLDDNQDSENYGTRKFADYMRIKMECVLNSLQRDPEVLWVDADVVFLENCLDYIQNYDGDFVVQDDGWGPCTGFFLARRTKVAVQVLQTIVHKLRVGEKIDGKVVDDQTWFSALYTKNPIVVNKLPIAYYPNGTVYFTEENRSLAKMFHNNCIVGTDKKIERFKKIGHWNPTPLDLPNVRKAGMVNMLNL